MSAQSAASVSRLRPWRVPLLSQRKPAQVADLAGRTLEQLARSALARAPAVLGDVTAASQAPVELRGYVDVPEIADRAWRFIQDGCEIFCIVDEPSERAVLNLVLGCPPALRLTPVERSIVTESISRLLGLHGEAQASFREEPRKRPGAQSWRCAVELMGNKKQQATLQLFTPCPPPPPSTLGGPHLDEVPLHLRVAFPAIGCAIAELSSWRSGTVLRLRRPARDVCAVLYAGGHRVATAHLGALYGERAVKLIELNASIS